jgi:hypothetical protein
VVTRGVHKERVTLANAAGVAFPVAIVEFKKPAARASGDDEARAPITFAAKELAPWKVRVDFLIYDQPGKWGSHTFEYVPVGIALVLTGDLSIDTANEAHEDIKKRASVVHRAFARNLESYCYQAELLLRDARDELDDVRLAILKGRAHKHLPLVVALFKLLAGHEQEARVREMAEILCVDRSTVFRVLEKAREAGLIAEDELDGRSRRSSARRKQRAA